MQWRICRQKFVFNYLRDKDPNMKKLLAACAILVSSCAFAKLPADYQEVEVRNDMRTFVNQSKSAVFAVQTVESGADLPAKDLLDATAKMLKCSNPVNGDAESAYVEQCDVQGQVMDIALVKHNSKSYVFYRNNNVTDEELDALMEEAFNK